MKIIICGNARHGKDTVADLIYPDGWVSSSAFVNEFLMYPLLKDLYGYKTLQECFADRVNHRQEWYETIKAYNTPDLAKLGRVILSKHDMYVGIRNIAELTAIKEQKLVDLVIWVDAAKRLPSEPTTSNTITVDDADYVLDNNGTLEELAQNVHTLKQQLIGI